MHDEESQTNARGRSTRRRGRPMHEAEARGGEADQCTRRRVRPMHDEESQTNAQGRSTRRRVIPMHEAEARHRVQCEVHRQSMRLRRLAMPCHSSQPLPHARACVCVRTRYAPALASGRSAQDMHRCTWVMSQGPYLETTVMSRATDYLGGCCYTTYLDSPPCIFSG
jgi:hypothetical protein